MQCAPLTHSLIRLCPVTGLPKDDGVELDILGVHHAEGVKERGRRTGLNETRREELHGFLKERFAINLEIADKVTRLDSCHAGGSPCRTSVIGRRGSSTGELPHVYGHEQ